MAFTAIDSIRQAEFSAQKRIEKAQLDAEISEKDAKQKAYKIIKDAKETASKLIESEKNIALKKAEDIVIDAKNTAILEADALEEECADKQNLINKKILRLIVNQS